MAASKYGIQCPGYSWEPSALPRQVYIAASKRAALDWALPPSRTLPTDAGETLERGKWRARVSPVAQLRDGGMVQRLPPGAAREESTGNVYHVRRMRSFVKDRCATTFAEAACGLRAFVFVTGDFFFAVGHAKALTPTADVGGIGSAVRKPACVRMIVPSPTGGEIDLEANRAAKTFPADMPRIRGHFLSHWIKSCKHAVAKSCMSSGLQVGAAVLIMTGGTIADARAAIARSYRSAAPRFSSIGAGLPGLANARPADPVPSSKSARMSTSFPASPRRDPLVIGRQSYAWINTQLAWVAPAVWARFSIPSEKPTRALASLVPCCSAVLQNCWPAESPARCNTFS
jgi:hypothetical protein